MKYFIFNFFQITFIFLFLQKIASIKPEIENNCKENETLVQFSNKSLCVNICEQRKCKSKEICLNGYCLSKAKFNFLTKQKSFIHLNDEFCFELVCIKYSGIPAKILSLVGNPAHIPSKSRLPISFSFLEKVPKEAILSGTVQLKGETCQDHKHTEAHCHDHKETHKEHHIEEHKHEHTHEHVHELDHLHEEEHEHTHMHEHLNAHQEIHAAQHVHEHHHIHDLYHHYPDLFLKQFIHNFDHAHDFDKSHKQQKENHPLSQESHYDKMSLISKNVTIEKPIENFKSPPSYFGIYNGFYPLSAYQRNMFPSSFSSQIYPSFNQQVYSPQYSPFPIQEYKMPPPQISNENAVDLSKPATKEDLNEFIDFAKTENSLMTKPADLVFSSDEALKEESKVTEDDFVNENNLDKFLNAQEKIGRFLRRRNDSIKM